jgi:hypothetical protein
MWLPPLLRGSHLIETSWWNHFHYTGSEVGVPSLEENKRGLVGIKEQDVSRWLTNQLIDWLINSIQQNPSWEAGKEIPHILMNPEIHSRVLKSPIISQNF